MAIWDYAIAGATYTTPKAAEAALYLARGSNPFTQEENVRHVGAAGEVFEDSSGDVIHPNTGLNPTATYRLVYDAGVGSGPIWDDSGGSALAWIEGIDYVTLRDIIGTSPSGAQTYGFLFYNTSRYGIVDGCTLRDMPGIAINPHTNSNSLTVQDCVGSNCATFLSVYGSCDGTQLLDSTVRDVDTLLVKGTGSVALERNLVSRVASYWNLGNSGTVTLRRNFVLQTAWIYFTASCGIPTLENNVVVIRAGQTYGIVTAVSASVFYHNAIFQNANASALHFYGAAATYGVNRNNLLVGGSARQTTALIVVDNGSGTGYAASKNRYLFINEADLFDGTWQGAAQETIAAWMTASGETSSTAGDPLVNDMDRLDFRPVPGSPLLAAGVNVGVTTDILGVTRADPPTIGPYEDAYTGAGAGGISRSRAVNGGAP